MFQLFDTLQEAIDYNDACTALLNLPQDGVTQSWSPIYGPTKQGKYYVYSYDGTGVQPQLSWFV